MSEKRNFKESSIEEKEDYGPSNKRRRCELPMQVLMNSLQITTHNQIIKEELPEIMQICYDEDKIDNPRIKTANKTLTIKVGDINNINIDQSDLQWGFCWQYKKYIFSVCKPIGNVTYQQIKQAMQCDYIYSGLTQETVVELYGMAKKTHVIMKKWGDIPESIMRQAIKNKVRYDVYDQVKDIVYLDKKKKEELNCGINNNIKIREACNYMNYFHGLDTDEDSDEDSDKHDHEMQIMMKMSYLQERITELYKVKLQITSLFEIKDTADFKLQHKKEQATIMEIVDMLKDMRNLNVDYFNNYCTENVWAAHLMNVFANEVIENKWDAF